VFQYIDSHPKYSKTVKSMAKVISLVESRCHHFWRCGVHGSASHNYFPLREKNRQGGFGIMQLTSREFLSRETIWSWKKNVDMSLSYISRCYEIGKDHLSRHPEGVTEKMIVLETYNRYNGGLFSRYYWWNDGTRPGLSKGWIKFGYIPSGIENKGYRDYNGDGKADPDGNPWNIPPKKDSGKIIDGPNKAVNRAAFYADRALSFGKI
ncbi:MAG: hypothetical protein JW928_08940, partial [Candidatus Aureabacteria bacterium]|nr:hypothetical protein [Candidatus Auribacterota bacterium]